VKVLDVFFENFGIFLKQFLAANEGGIGSAGKSDQMRSASGAAKRGESWGGFQVLRDRLSGDADVFRNVAAIHRVMLVAG
jgi:hypothetical protein